MEPQAEDNPDRCRDLMGRAVQAGGAILRAAADAPEVVTQDGRDIKLAQDRLSQDAILRVLREESALPVLTEESGWVGAAPIQEDALYWTVDPLDGSYNYARGLPLYCVCLALCRGWTPLYGCTLDAARGELFWGGRSVGLEVDGRPVAPAAPRRDVFATGLPVAGDHDAAGQRLQAAVQGWRKVRMIGTAGLSLAWVARGAMDGYAEVGIRWWDVAAGLALVEGAGGAYTAKGEALTAPLAVSASRASLSEAARSSSEASCP